MAFKAQNILLIFMCVAAFLISLMIAPYHIAGDQVHYTKVYSSLRGTDIWTGRQVYLTQIFSFEYTHFFIVWVFANLGFDKVISMSALNSVLTALFAKFLMGKTRNYILVLLLVVTNVYLYTMFFTLEKLKIGSIFLLMGIIYKRNIWIILSSVSHVQIFLITLNYLMSGYMQNIFRFTGLTIKKKSLITISGGAILFSIISYILGSYIMSKYAYYNSNTTSFAFVPVLSFALISIFTLFFSEKKAACFFYFVILFFMILMVGAERLNMFAVFGCFFFVRFRGVYERNGLIFVTGLLLLSTYLAYKSFNYINMLILYGG